MFLRFERCKNTRGESLARVIGHVYPVLFVQ